MTLIRLMQNIYSDYPACKNPPNKSFFFLRGLNVYVLIAR